jgi:hypothetical protein
VHRALSKADAGAIAQPEPAELDRVEHVDELEVAAGIGGES